MRWLMITALALLAVVIAGCAQQAPMAPTQPAPAPHEPMTQPTQPAEPAQPAAPAEKPMADQGKEGETMAEPKKEVMTGEAMVTKESGVIRSAGCEPESKTVYFTLTNPTKTEWTFYKKVVPTPPNMLKVSFNGMTLTGFNCDQETVPPGETVKCSVTDGLIKFREPQTEFQDDLSTVATGGRDEVKFRCIPRGDWTPQTEEDYSTRVE